MKKFLLLLALAINSVSMANHKNTNFFVVHPSHVDISKPLIQIAFAKGLKHPHMLRRRIFQMTTLQPSQMDSVLQTFANENLPIISTLSTEGLGVGLPGFVPGGTPPDPTGSVGLTQYVQIVNTSYAVFDKADGHILLGPFDTNSIWSGFGGVCENTNQGDGIVKFDQLANRWFISQFAFNATPCDDPAPPFTQCVAVSATPDATGIFYRYSYEFEFFNDYAKVGLMPQAYFMSFDFFNNDGDFVGPAACAIDRAQILEGSANADMQCFHKVSLNGEWLPADLDGKRLPPTNTPGFYLSLNLENNSIDLWKFFVNFNHPTLSRFIGPTPVNNISPFTIACPNDPSNCVPQPVTAQRLDALSDRFMYRLAYRELIKTGVLLVNQTIMTPHASAAVRWYQINILHDGQYIPRLYQQGTYSLGTSNRWMASIAMDKNQNIAMGYSVSSDSLFPSIRITGRMSADERDVMRAEQILMAGTGSQAGSNRWGDYTTMSIDPVDDCTFWYTNEYIPVTGLDANWGTRINAFRFPDCHA